MSRCDQEKEPVKTLCNNLNQLIDDSKKAYENVKEGDKDRLNQVLTWLDREYHSFFKEVGITSDIFIPALDNIYKKINDLDQKIDKNSSASANIDLTDLAKEQNLMDLAKKIDDIEGNINKIGNLAKTSDLKSLVKKGDLDNLVTKGDLGIKNANFDLKKLAQKDDIKDLTKQINDHANTPVSLDGLAKEQDLKSLAQEVDSIKIATNKIDDLNQKVSSLAKATDLNNLAKTGDLKDLAKTTDLPDISNLATKADIPDLSNLVQKSDIDKLNKQIADFAKQDKAFDQAITKEIKAISQEVNIMPQEVSVVLAKGNEIADKYEAEIKLADSNSKIGIFSPKGYYFYDGTIYVYDHLRSEVSIDLPEHFHFLKVIKTEDSKYKLAFCNKGGELYYGVPNDYKLINPIDIKSTKSIDFNKYYAENGSSPSFIAKMSSSSYPNPNSHQYGVDVYEIGYGEKKIGSLIDEFGYYDSQNKFHYSDNHLGIQNHSYDSPLFIINKGEDNKCSLHKMQEGTDDIDLTSDAAACSLVEYVANYVNGVYF
ncbi:MAG: hypothetical protein U0X86_000995 [Wolbachia endosymbiont of Xenopsylla cheopis]